METWWNTAYTHRIPITLHAEEFTRIDKTIDVEINLTRLLTPLGQKVSSDPYIFSVVEIDDNGFVLADPIPCQFNIDDRNNSMGEVYVTLTIFLAGVTQVGTTRQFYTYFSTQDEPSSASSTPNLVKLTDEVIHEGQASYKVETPSATYIYHKFGAGFASLFDPDGFDWISFHPWGGSDGIYRGIPNLVHPEGYFHPGNEGCESEIIHAGPIKMTILSTSRDGLWQCEWDITPSYAKLTVLKADQPYWFLYEGTPAGILDEQEDYIVRSNGDCTLASVSWDGPLPEPEWLYFGTRQLDRVLYLVHDEHDEAVDSYWPMEHNMTVFGFGRLNLNKYMQSTPAHFTIGFAESSDFAAVSTIIDSAYRPIHIEVGRCQVLEHTCE